jgi:spore cortex biosynthesis protein YabQ
MTVSASIGQEILFLGSSLLLGVVLFFLYDILRIFRRVIPHGNVWIGIEDFIYWIIFTAAVFLMLYQKNDGMVRGFALGGMGAGMLLYFLTISHIVVRINVRILRTVLEILGKIGGVAVRPICKIIKKVVGFFRKQLKKLLRAIKMGLRKR